jgi:hypothetical protein
MSGRTAKAARRALGEDALKDPKRPTRPYLTKKEQQEKRRRERAAAKRAAERQEKMAAKLGAALDRGRAKAADQ